MLKIQSPEMMVAFLTLKYSHYHFKSVTELNLWPVNTPRMFTLMTLMYLIPYGKKNVRQAHIKVS